MSRTLSVPAGSTSALLAAALFLVSGTAHAAASERDPGSPARALLPTHAASPVAPPCAATVVAEVVALDQVLVWNKFGSRDPYGMIFALKRDVVSQGSSSPNNTTLVPGQVQLRSDLRPRPLTLRVNKGECLEVRFTNLLDPEQWSYETPATRSASFHVNGMPYLTIADDGANVGNNQSSLAAPGQTKIYTFYADREGTYCALSMGALVGGQGDGGSTVHGLFGAVIVEPAGSQWLHSATGLPMRVNNQIVSADDKAIISGFTDPTDGVEATPEGNFREFVWIFHDEAKTVHANPRLDQEFWLHSVRDAFGINYGISGLGQILLDALCAPDCRYEEAFLSSWANGDPALLPHFTDDPANVWHSYLGDNVKIRHIHAGPAETHVFHLHAHQWLYSPDDQNSTYLDSQACGPGTAFTFEVSYAGSGNRNMSVGDAIFHCHLYPHFAQGMWGLWRVHDVFEDGSRRLPDGTPIPRVAPIPGKALPPLPSANLPGYPMFIPGVAGRWPVQGYPGNFKPGHRPPQPPLDMVADGGLPRHIIIEGPTQGGLLDKAFVPNTLTNYVVVPENGDLPQSGYNYAILPQGGTRLERNAMAFHASRTGGTSGIWGSVPSKRWDSPATNPVATDYTSSSRPTMPFVVNGRPPAPGAPYANPCPPGAPVRTYKGSTIDVELVVNKAGWHDPQGRITVLENDVQDTLTGARAAEPLFIRANSNDCIVFHHTNRTARELHEDAFQVQTPTDTLGMHIHLVKFDVTSSDGSGNGWNYEDGTYSPEEVHDRLLAMGFPDGHPNSTGGTSRYQTTAQLWWADPLLNGSGTDRTIRTVFMHDHFGPSSIQQHGCYAALVVEPAGSTWWDPETGVQFGTRADGGPTSWRADIRTGANGSDSFREFCLAIADFAILYDEAGNPIHPPRDNGVITPEAVSAHSPGTMLLNYRNEPVPLRIGQMVSNGSHNIRSLKSGNAGRMPFFFSSETHGDPVTPIMRMYQGDKYQIRIVQGSHEESHAMKIPRSKWLRDTSSPNSGYTNSQHIGISEHFEFNGNAIAMTPFPVKVGRTTFPNSPTASDMLWVDGSEDGIWNGVWGLMRVFGGTSATDPATGQRVTLRPLPNNPQGISAGNSRDFNWPCPKTAPVRTYNVAAVTAASVVGTDGITYNQRLDLFDNTGLMFVRAEDIDSTTGRLRPGVPVEPLVIRANAGDCLQINLSNRLPSVRNSVPDNPSTDARMQNLTRLNVNNMITDNMVGMSIDLVYGDAATEGSHIGRNPSSLVSPGASRTFTWYCGDLTYNSSTRNMVATPVAFGTCGIRSWGDAIKQGPQGLFGALIVEPQGSTWSNATGTTAVITAPAGSGTPSRYREFVVLQQSGLNLHQSSVGNHIPDDEAEGDDPGEKGYNYRAEPIWGRLNSSYLNSDQLNQEDQSNALSGAIETPVFVADAGERVVFRFAKVAGRASCRTSVFTIHGHRWLDMHANPLSNVWGQQHSITVGSNLNLWLLDGAGGPNGVRGDFLFRELNLPMFAQGLWGIFRVR